MVGEAINLRGKLCSVAIMVYIYMYIQSSISMEFHRVCMLVLMVV